MDFDAIINKIHKFTSGQIPKEIIKRFSESDMLNWDKGIDEIVADPNQANSFRVPEQKLNQAVGTHMLEQQGITPPNRIPPEPEAPLSAGIGGPSYKTPRERMGHTASSTPSGRVGNMFSGITGGGPSQKPMKFRVPLGVDIMGGEPNPTGTVSPPQSGQPYPYPKNLNIPPGIMGGMKQAHDRQGLPVPPYTPSGVGLGGATPQPPQPPPQPPQIPLRRTPSKWDMMKEGMFAGEDQRGLFGKAGVDPKTGKDSGYMGLSGYFNRLFDDPGRMAMLSGGLSAMDPSSYYDKQGFGSPWTGLRGAFGAAQGGAKSVHDARKAKADLEKTKAEAEAELSGSPKYKSAQIGDATYLYSDADIQRRRNELMADGKTGWQKATNMAILEAGTKIEKGITPNKRYKIKMEYSSGQLIGETIDESLKLAADSFNVGGIGFGKRAWDGAKGIFSIDGKQTDATKLVNNIHKIVSQKWKDLVGGGQLSKNDELFIQKVIKNPENVFTTASEIRKSLNNIKRINDELQYRRAAILNIEHTSAGSSPTLKGGGDVDALIEEFK